LVAHVSHAAPWKPLTQTQLPSFCATPLPLQVVAPAYSQALPAKPVSQTQLPVAEHSPFPVQEVAASQYTQLGNP
jgi:hypothetical protein